MPVGAGMDFFDILVRYETELWNHLDRRLAEAGAISLAQLEALRVIHRRTDCRVQEVSRDLAITVGAASKLVDRLERAGLAERRPNPSDRRSTLLRLTADGTAALGRADAIAGAALAEHLDGADADIRLITATLAGLRTRLTPTAVTA